MKKILLMIAAALFFIEPAVADTETSLHNAKDFWEEFSLSFDKKLYLEIKNDGLLGYRLEKFDETRELEEADGRKIIVMPGAPLFIFKAVSRAASEPLTRYLNQFELVQNVRELLKKYGRVVFSISFLADETSRDKLYNLNPKAEFELGIKETSDRLSQDKKIRSSLRFKAGFQVIDDKTFINNTKELSLSFHPGVSLEYDWQDFLKVGGRITFPGSNLIFYLVPERRFFTVSAISDFILSDKRLGFYLSKDFGNRTFTVRSSYFLETEETQITFHFFYQF